MNNYSSVIHSTRESLSEKLIDPPEEVLDELLAILSKHGFELDTSIKHENPSKNYSGGYHIQVINNNLTYRDADQWRDVLTPLIDEIHEFEERVNCPITWNFGPNDSNIVTAGLDIMKQYIEESLEEDYSINDDEYGKPYTYRQIERNLRDITNNFKDHSGAVRCHYPEEHRDGLKILSRYYEEVEDLGLRGTGEAAEYMIKYSTPKANESLTEHKRYDTNALKRKLISCIDYLDTIEAEFPASKFLATSWEDLRDGLEFGIDDTFESAEVIHDYLKGILNNSSDTELNNLYDNLVFSMNNYLEYNGYDANIE